MQHLAMIMDGNRRWARENKLGAVTLGHKKGLDAAKTVVRFCLKNNIKYLSLFAFSLENSRRDASEKSYLFKLLSNLLENEIEGFTERGIRIRFVGDRDLFPPDIVPIIIEAENKTKHLSRLNLNLLFFYGAQQEVAYAAKRIAKKVQNGDLSVDEINKDVLRKEMWLNGAPDPEVIVRTGKVSRLSNFLLFQAAYSELMFLDCYWPEITENILDRCVDEFYATQRNFGK